MDHIIKEFGVLPTEVSPVRSRVINTASSTRESSTNGRPDNVCTKSLRPLVQEQQDFYEESRRKIVRGAQAYAESIIERQQVELPTVCVCTGVGLIRAIDCYGCFGTHSTLQRASPDHDPEVNLGSFSPVDPVPYGIFFLDLLSRSLYYLAIAASVAYIHVFQGKGG